VEQVQVTPEVEAVPTSGRVYAQSEITFSAAGNAIKDATAIKIGDETYIFALKKSTMEKFAESAAKVIDLTDQLDANGALTTAGYKKAAERLAAAAADNTRFKVGANIGEDGKVTFTEKEGGVDYSVNNLSGTDGKATINGATNAGTANGQDAANSDWKGRAHNR